MFEYADARKVKMRLGQYVAHNIVKDGFTSRVVRSPDQLNVMDRIELANAFLASEQRKYFDRDLFHTPDPKKLIHDIARYIDQRIPKAYANWYNYGKGKDQEFSAAKYGLIYQFPENNVLEVNENEKSKAWKSDALASEKQTKYLKNLISSAGYLLKVDYDDLTREVASQLISHFVNDEALPEELQQLLEYDIEIL